VNSRDVGVNPVRPCPAFPLQLRKKTLSSLETSDSYGIAPWLDSRRFFDIIGRVIAKANSSTLSDRPCATVFGEMVAVLWADDAHQAAIRLESFGMSWRQSLTFFFVARIR